MEEITLKDIKKSIINNLKKLNIKIYASEVKEGFELPCFFVSIDKLETSKINTKLHKKYMEIYIRYIDTKIEDIKKAEIIEKLDEIFSDALKIDNKNRYLTIHEKTYTIHEEYIEMNFNLEFYGLKTETEEQNSELINSFEIDFKPL